MSVTSSIHLPFGPLLPQGCNEEGCIAGVTLFFTLFGGGPHWLREVTHPGSSRSSTIASYATALPQLVSELPVGLRLRKWKYHRHGIEWVKVTAARSKSSLASA